MGLATNDPLGGTNPTKVDRQSDRDLVMSRYFDAPAHLVYRAWTTPELFMRWWPPQSIGVPLRACEMDVRTGGSYRLAFGHDGADSWEFFGRYVEVVPNARLVWTNEEEAHGAVTTVTFEAQEGRTRLVLRDHYPTKEALDDAFIGMEGSMPEQFDQLAALLETLAREL